MKIIDFLFEKQINRAVEQKAQEVFFRGEDTYFKAIYGTMLQNGFLLKPDSNYGNYIKQGFEENIDVYSLLMRIATQGSQVEWEVYRGKEEVEKDVKHPLNVFLKTPNNYQTYTELITNWQLFHLITGNGLIYYPTIKEGNNRGALMQNIGAFVLPSQDISIESGGFLKPILNYIVDTNILPESKLPVEDVIHTRLPNLDFTNGSNLMGMSPIKVAAKVIQMQNHGLDRIDNLYETGIPPGLLAKIFNDPNLDNSGVTDPARKSFEKAWKQKAQKGMPITAHGDHKWIPFGTDIVRDLDIVNTYPLGLRLLCNLWGLPSNIFNDVAGTTFNNMEQATKAIWVNRLIPDYYMLSEKINQKIQVLYPGYEVWPCFDKIPELQKNKKELSEVYYGGYDRGLYMVDEVREKLDDEKIGGEYGKSFHQPMGNTLDPLGDNELRKINEAEQNLNNRNVQDYKK